MQDRVDDLDELLEESAEFSGKLKKTPAEQDKSGDEENVLGVNQTQKEQTRLALQTFRSEYVPRAKQQELLEERTRC